jgi:hypothetical protein
MPPVFCYSKLTTVNLILSDTFTTVTEKVHITQQEVLTYLEVYQPVYEWFKVYVVNRLNFSGTPTVILLCEVRCP